MKQKFLVNPTATMVELIKGKFPELSYNYTRDRVQFEGFDIQRHEIVEIRSFVRDTLAGQGYNMNRGAFNDALAVAAIELTGEK